MCGVAFYNVKEQFQLQVSHSIFTSFLGHLGEFGKIGKENQDILGY